jgi:hypothetical protein
LNRPRKDAFQSQLSETYLKELGDRSCGIAFPAKMPFPQHIPELRSLEFVCKICEGYHADRAIIVFICGIQPDEIAPPMYHDFQRHGIENLAPAAEIKPLIVLFPLKPLNNEGNMRRG